MASTITRSIRLTTEETANMRSLAEREALPEAVMLRKLFREGLRVRLLETAIAAYCAGQASLGEAAQMAELPYLAFFEELRRRRIVVLDESANLAGELADLAEKFGRARLAQVAGEL
jgi:predicted HTH domain antitoxin